MHAWLVLSITVFFTFAVHCEETVAYVPDKRSKGSSDNADSIAADTTADTANPSVNATTGESGQCVDAKDAKCILAKMLPKVWDNTTASFTERGARAIRRIFEVVDADNSGDWDRKEFQGFGVKTNGAAFPEEQLDDALAFFHTNEKKNLDWLGFAQFYTTQTNDVPEETVKDLLTFGYDSSLRNLEKNFWSNLTGFSEGSKIALNDIFNRFDVDGNKHWHTSEFSAFSNVTNGEPYPEAEIKAFIKHFDLGPTGELTLLGFFQYMLYQAKTFPDELYSDVSKFGYDDEFRNIKVFFDGAQFTKKGLETLREIFIALDRDGNQKWNEAEMQFFGNSTNGKDFGEDVKLFCKLYECENGELTFLGFAQFYATQSLADPNETWKDLSRFGYDYQLANPIRDKNRQAQEREAMRLQQQALKGTSMGSTAGVESVAAAAAGGEGAKEDKGDGGAVLEQYFDQALDAPHPPADFVDG